jgi:hypothetical protein
MKQEYIRIFRYRRNKAISTPASCSEAKNTSSEEGGLKTTTDYITVIMFS